MCSGHLLFFTGDSSHSSLLDLISDLTDKLLFILCGTIQRQISVISKPAEAVIRSLDSTTSSSHAFSTEGFWPLQGSFLWSSGSEAAIGFILACEEWQPLRVDFFFPDRIPQDVSQGSMFQEGNLLRALSEHYGSWRAQ